MHKICKCYHTWGKESDDCMVGFVAKFPNEDFCDPCKSIARKARVAYNVSRYRQRQKHAGYEHDITNPDWTGCWIDRVCSCCGVKGVPTFNRFLCIRCWETYADGDYSVGVSMDGDITWTEYDESPSKVKVYSSKYKSQYDLWALVNECRTGWKWTVPLPMRLKRLLSSMGLQGGNCSAY